MVSGAETIEAGESCVACFVNGAAHAGFFEQETHLIQFAHIIDGDRTHTVAFARQHLDQVLHLEAEQRIAHRRFGDIVTGRQIVFVDARPRCQLARKDIGANVVIDTIADQPAIGDRTIIKHV